MTAAVCILVALSATLVSSSPEETRILEFRETNFSTLNQNVTYKSSKANEPKGMAPLYKITNQILDLFLGDEPIAEGKKYGFAYLKIS